MRNYFTFLVVSVSLIGCDYSGRTHAHLDATFGNGIGIPPFPVEIDERLKDEVKKNTIHRVGLDIYQDIEINGPIRIVPAEGPLPLRPAATTRAGS